MNRIHAAALEIQEFCRLRRWSFCFIGALAVQRWGEPRLTQDVDLTILTGFGREGDYVEALLERSSGRRPDAIVFKAFAARDKDWLDEGIAVRQGSHLDEGLVWRELNPLLELKGAPEIAHRLRVLPARPSA